LSFRPPVPYSFQHWPSTDTRTGPRKTLALGPETYAPPSPNGVSGPRDHLWAVQCGGGATAPSGAIFTEPAPRAHVALDSAQLAELAVPAHTAIGAKVIALLPMINGHQQLRVRATRAICRHGTRSSRWDHPERPARPTVGEPQRGLPPGPLQFKQDIFGASTR
jgi:hypothetical protein